jgi:uncharacterized protein YecE (DUF72 family)
MTAIELCATPRAGKTGVRIGTSGWTYGTWRGVFYPKGLPHRLELNYIGRCFNTVEINATFYRLQRPDVFRRWAADTPDGFVFAVKDLGALAEKKGTSAAFGKRIAELRSRHARKGSLIKRFDEAGLK